MKSPEKRLRRRAKRRAGGR
ncbi:hypothetical protein E2C01_081281 [Portunus trituberculatus]|uniref:Uncharacterized protein n=1 Tax=Portunus trituberculatus TaxID=210409 RepID=A0A5B7IRI6_PORTR|nr:hypothetical protein [Portunus trituberculatus]